jgi:hypothetical protein
VDYSPNGYRLGDIQKWKLIISMEVVFNESIMDFDICESFNDSGSIEEPVIVETITAERRIQEVLAEEDKGDQAAPCSGEDSGKNRQVLRNTQLTILWQKIGHGQMQRGLPIFDWFEWKIAIDDELKSMYNNRVWTTVEKLSRDATAFNSNRIFSVK